MRLQQPKHFVKGVHYDSLPWTESKYKYVTKDPVAFRIWEWCHGYPAGTEIDFGWLRIIFNTAESASFLIAHSYAWDGATMAPDCPDVILPSLIHDALVQYEKEDNFPLSKAEVDEIFLMSMKLTKFKLAKVYFWAVKAYSPFR